MESDGQLRQALNRLRVWIGAVTVTAAVIAWASALASADKNDRFIFHDGHVVGADGGFAFVLHPEKRPDLIEVNYVFNASTRCVNSDTGEVRRSHVDVSFDRWRVIHKRFHQTRINTFRAHWLGPHGIATPRTRYEVKGHLWRGGFRAEGKFSASATVHRVWDCTAGPYRWRTQGRTVAHALSPGGHS